MRLKLSVKTMSEFKSTKSYRDAAEYYDLFTVSNDIPFYLSMAEKYGSPILELACGTGRVALKLAEAGYEWNKDGRLCYPKGKTETLKPAY